LPLPKCYYYPELARVSRVHAEGEMTMNDANALTEIKASLALGDLKRRERLLKTIRGKSEVTIMTIVFVGVLVMIIVTHYLFHGEKADDKPQLFLVIPLWFAIAGVYVNISRRMNALIELVGEEYLRKPETDGKE